MSDRYILGIECWPYRSEAEGSALRELESLSDRAAGIVALSLLENSLVSVLLDSFIDLDKTSLKELLGESGPLGIFSAKIKMAFALGLVSADGKNDLDVIRRIRNDFAHNLSESTFDSAKTKNRCLSLKLVDGIVSFDVWPGFDAAQLKSMMRFPEGSKEALQLDELAASATAEGAPYKQTAFCFPGFSPGWLKDPRARFFLTINYFVGNMLVRGPRRAAAEPYF